MRAAQFCVSASGGQWDYSAEFAEDKMEMHRSERLCCHLPRWPKPAGHPPGARHQLDELLTWGGNTEVWLGGKMAGWADSLGPRGHSAFSDAPWCVDPSSWVTPIRSNPPNGNWGPYTKTMLPSENLSAWRKSSQRASVQMRRYRQHLMLCTMRPAADDSKVQSLEVLVRC